MSGFVYRIADFDFNIIDKYQKFEVGFKDYIVDDGEPSATFSCNDSDIECERVEGENFSKGYLENIAVHRKIGEWLPNNNAFVLHSATFDVDGIGVAFAAHSGTGKTTHMNLWQQYLGDRMVVVNGDKPIVRFFDDEPEQPYAYGTPWRGKEKLGCNMRTPLKHICFIERSETNYVEKTEKASAISRMFNQVYVPKDPIALMRIMQLLDKLLTCCNIWTIHCNMEKEAAEVAYKTIFAQKK